MHKQEKVNKTYDPAAGSGSLLLQAKNHFDNHIIEEGFYGQEVNHTTYNLARMNMFLHNINYDKFNIALGDTLLILTLVMISLLMRLFLIHLTRSTGLAMATLP